MIKVFGATDTDFTSNGDIVLRPIKAKVHKEDNGEYYLDLECGLEYLDYIVENNIVVAPVSTSSSGQNPTQAFRVHNVTVTNEKITARCRHVFWDALNYFIYWADGYALNEHNLVETLEEYEAATEPAQSLFVASSDIINDAQRQYRADRISLFEAVLLLCINKNVNGHMSYDNWEYGIYESVGTDNGFVIRYGSNLKGITKSENWNDVITKLCPTGKDGITLDAVGPSAGKYIETTYYSRYDMKYVTTLAFSQDNIKRENYNTEAAYKSALVDDLRQKANDYINYYQVWLPRVTYEVKALIDRKVDIGDTIIVIDERLGLNLTTHVISYDYDCIMDRCENVQFGTFTENAKGMGNTIKKLTNDTENGVIGGKQLQFNSDNSVTWLNW